ncbi:hypothetical protein C8F04DRAFT_1146867 [Mycena alexandri]|uniref:Uncharacterized protein n=1 Tax=Mycena alexandri TaxID=1745969 RepID=A0AAD6S4D5_9AGAR|nr:hypothetical protein C8F04DRAFT_1146867 [Mycena alexandri]
MEFPTPTCFLSFFSFFFHIVFVAYCVAYFSLSRFLFVPSFFFLFLLSYFRLLQSLSSRMTPWVVAWTLLV